VVPSIRELLIETEDVQHVVSIGDSHDKAVSEADSCGLCPELHACCLVEGCGIGEKELTTGEKEFVHNPERSVVTTFLTQHIECLNEHVGWYENSSLLCTQESRFFHSSAMVVIGINRQ